MKFNTTRLLKPYQFLHKKPNYIVDNPSSLPTLKPAHPFSLWEKGMRTFMHFKNNTTLNSDESARRHGIPIRIAIGIGSGVCRPVRGSFILSSVSRPAALPFGQVAYFFIPTNNRTDKSGEYNMQFKFYMTFNTEQLARWPGIPIAIGSGGRRDLRGDTLEIQLMISTHN